MVQQFTVMKVANVCFTLLNHEPETVNFLKLP